MQTVAIQKEQDMHLFAKEFAQKLKGGEVVFLKGDLGAGKTTFTRGVLRALGFEGRVKSPTFTIMEPYELQDFNFYHYDLYRLADPEELEYLGIRDQLNGKDILFVEWPERAGAYLKADIEVEINVLDGEARNITMLFNL